MGFFDRIFKREERAFFPNNDSGLITTTLFSEDTNPTVLSCANKIANTLSELKLSLYVRRKGGGRSPAVFHPLFSVIEKPSLEETPTLFYNTMVRHLLLKGNAYLYLGRNASGDIVTFSIINPDNVRIERDSTYHKYFIINGKNYTERDILHIPYSGAGYNGTKGKSPIEVVKDLIVLDNQLLTYTKNYFNNSIGTRVGLELGASWPTKATELDKLYAAIIPAINKYVTGAGNAGKVMIPPPDTKLAKIEQPSNVEAELNSLMVMVEKQIAQAFSVPYDLISGENKYNSLEQRQQNFLSETIKPLGDHICQSFEKLLTPQDAMLYFSYDYKTLLQTDTKSTIEALAKEISYGMVSVNEARAKLDMDSIGEVGDNYFMQASYYPLTQENIDAFFAASKLALAQTGSHNPSGDDKN
jgi:HK97 family phage portal protein